MIKVVNILAILIVLIMLKLNFFVWNSQGRHLLPIS